MKNLPPILLQSRGFFIRSDKAKIMRIENIGFEGNRQSISVRSGNIFLGFVYYKVSYYKSSGMVGMTRGKGAFESFKILDFICRVK